MLRRGASQLQQHLSRAGQCARTAAGTAGTLQGLELDTATPTTSSPSCHESTARLVFSAHEQQQQQQQGWACQWQAAAGPRSHGPGTHHARQPPWALSASCLHTATVPQGYVQSWTEVEDADNLDPFALVRREVQIVSERLRSSVVSTVPVLRQAAEYFFRPGVEGKRLRPTLALLMASALSPSAPDEQFLKVDLRPASEHAPELRRQHQRLAEISELIHVASLLHDDVIDDASTRRGIAALNINVGNKTAILAGDFLLARASVSLAALRNSETVELMSQVLENLVTGEIMQMTATEAQLMDLEFYMQKTFCKTASLMANSAKSIAVLSGQPRMVCDTAEAYGRHLGLAFQIVDDILDLTASSSILGKPALNDIKSGLATVPVLFAAEEHPQMRQMILRKFKGSGDLSQAVAMIERSRGIQRARELAQHHCVMAAEMIRQLPEPQSDHAAICRAALIKITQKLLVRSK